MPATTTTPNDRAYETFDTKPVPYGQGEEKVWEVAVDSEGDLIHKGDLAIVISVPRPDSGTDWVGRLVSCHPRTLRQHEVDRHLSGDEVVAVGRPDFSLLSVGVEAVVSGSSWGLPGRCLRRVEAGSREHRLGEIAARRLRISNLQIGIVQASASITTEELAIADLQRRLEEA